MAKQRKHQKNRATETVANGHDHNQNIHLAFTEIKNQHIETVLAQYNQSKTATAHVHISKKICNKTGNTLAESNWFSSTTLVLAHGEKRAQELIDILACQQVDPAWIYCDNEALAALAVHDPIGYYVYALGLVFNFSEPTKENIVFKNELNEWLRSTADLRLIIETNEWLRRALSIFNKKQLSLTSDQNPEWTINNYCPLAILPTIKEKIRKAISASLTTTTPQGQRRVTLASVNAARYSNVGRHSAFSGSALTRQKTHDYEIADLLLAFDSLLPSPCKAAETDMRARKLQQHADRTAQQRREASRLTVDCNAELPTIKIAPAASEACK